MAVTIASGISIVITALQVPYALPPGNISNPINYPQLIQDDRYQTFNEVTIDTDVQLIDRTNVLSYGGQSLPSGYTGNINLHGFVSPIAAYGYFVGMLLDIKISWLSPFDEELYRVITRMSVKSINRSVSVSGAYEIDIEGEMNFNFDSGDLRFITPLSNTIPGNRGWIPKTPQLNELPFAC